ncbi:disulfide bond formation protein B [Acuticoccus sp. M5D2P5]|uniref:disulfide bond formation protein B n=1 Tax=Acuticoccus kalidii TaxID=2910977 RepID=UPI001F2E3C76|nr:disulfide bond formation protein B [Acuticoccus kalidii]MCF3934734.1 disulfide bond formation protein B [Acuticoccus kalidii]
MPERFAHALNILALFAISGILLFAFYDQFVGGDLPCPLCLLQRVGFCIVGAGLALNVIFGPSARHYGLMILGAVVGGAVALRQVALHVVPGTGAYGDPVFGLHFYTWAFIVFALVLVGAGIMLVFRPRPGIGGSFRSPMGLLATVLFFLVAFGNGVSTLAECGTGLCPDNPTSYEGYEALMERWADRSAN